MPGRRGGKTNAVEVLLGSRSQARKDTACLLGDTLLMGTEEECKSESEDEETKTATYFAKKHDTDARREACRGGRRVNKPNTARR